MSKCEFFSEEVNYLVHIIFKPRIHMDLEEVNPLPMASFKKPMELRLSYKYFQIVKFMLTFDVPICSCGHTSDDFGDQEHISHGVFKRDLKLLNVGQLRNPLLRLQILIDHSQSRQILATLYKLCHRKDVVWLFKVENLQVQWHTYENKLFAIMHGLNIWRHYLLGVRFEVTIPSSTPRRLLSFSNMWSKLHKKLMRMTWPRD